MQGIKQVDERSKVKLNKWAQLEGRMGPKKATIVDGNNGGHAKLVEGKAEQQGAGAGFEERPCVIMTTLSVRR